MAAWKLSLIIIYVLVFGTIAAYTLFWIEASRVGLFDLPHDDYLWKPASTPANNQKVSPLLVAATPGKEERLAATGRDPVMISTLQDLAVNLTCHPGGAAW